MVSIIIPVYNVEKYLKQCLDSVFNQSYKNIEVIVVNDGSTDESLNIINYYREKYSNLVYLEQDNKGVSEARNLALQHANGDYILYIDSDDYIENNMIELLYNKGINENLDIVICGHNEIYDDTIRGNNSSILLDMKEDNIYSGIQVGNMILEGKILGTLWNKLFKKDLLLKNKFYFEPGRYIQDWYPVFKIISLSNNISYVDKPLYNYRQRGTSTVNKKNKKLLEDYIYAVSKILNYIKVNNFTFNDYSISKFKLMTTDSIRYKFCSLNLKEGINIYKKFGQTYPEIKNISFIKYIVRSDLGKRVKFQSLLWDMKMLHIFINVEKKL